MNKREWMLQAALARLGWADSVAIDALAEVYDAICAATAPETDWVEHDGDVSEAPEERRMVEVVYEDGYTQKVLSDAIPWDVVAGDNNVVRWRYA